MRKQHQQPSVRTAEIDLRNPLEVDQQYILITHSDRPASLDKCDLNYLETRYSDPKRLPPQVPFDELRPSVAHSPYSGMITFHKPAPDLSRLELVGHFRPNTYKPQHAIWHAGRLWVLGVEHLEVYDPGLNSVGSVRDPWLAGGHTIVPDGNGHMLLSCSSSDSVLAVDMQTLQVVAAHRVPERLYGHNYSLTRKHSVVDHYITNDLQIAHVNCASPWRGGILVSSLIPGAIGWFSPRGEYSELLRGYVGLHGVRVAEDDTVYFCDSCNGMLVFAEYRNTSLAITKRIKIDSLWLHDAVRISKKIYALANFDKMAVALINVETREPVGTIDCADFGGPQFLAF